VKWKNYGLWVSIASLLYMTLKDMGLQIDLTHWETYVTTILGILIGLGVISNPENGKGYFNAKIPPSIDENTPTGQSSITNDSTNDLNESNEVPNQVMDQANNSHHMVETTDTQTKEEIVHDRKYIPHEK
jgi:uncharacterized membrane protein